MKENFLQDLPIEKLAALWGLSTRSAERWLESEPAAPLGRWFVMGDWHARLAKRTACKLTPAFVENIYAADDLRQRPRPGTAAMGIWLAAALAEHDQGEAITWPATVNAWLKGKNAKKPARIENPKLGRSSVRCVTMVQWLAFFSNRPYLESEFEEFEE